MNLKLKIWRQANAEAKGRMVTYSISNVSPDMSFLEMMDMHNEQLIQMGEDQLPLIMTAVRVFVGCVPCSSMERHMVLTDWLRPANYTCENSKMETP